MPVTILEWLSEGAPNDGRWHHWLEGDNQPYDASSDRPYRWFVEALLRMGDPRIANRKLLQRMSEILATPPATLLGARSVFRRPAQGLHNLLWLAAELASPKDLFTPLMAMRKAVDSGKGQWRKLWDEGWEGSLDPLLDRALTHNQAGPDLKDYWFARLQRKASPSVETLEPYVRALDGVIYMPASGNEIGQPWVAAITEALGLLALRLEEALPGEQHRTDRGKTFSRFVDDVIHSHPSWADPHNDILPEGAHSGEWPSWAIGRLRLLASKASDDPKLPVKVWVWKNLAEIIPSSFPHEPLKVQCRADMIVKLKVAPKTLRLIRVVSPLFEKSRLDNPFPGPGAIVAGINDALGGLQRQYPKQERVFAEMRKLLFEKLVVQSARGDEERAAFLEAAPRLPQPYKQIVHTLFPAT